MRDIAAASNMLAGSLYSHFTSKLQILQELMESYFAELLPRQRAVVAGSGTPAAPRTVRRSRGRSRIRRPEVAMVLRLDWHVIVTTPELTDVVANASESQHADQLIEEGVRSGELRDDVNAEAVSRMILIAITGLVDRRYLIPSDAGGQGRFHRGGDLAR